MKRRAITKPAIIYCATNLINGKRYIGITCRSLDLRVSEHMRAASGTSGMTYPFQSAIRKYGHNMFRFSVLRTCPTYEEALADERRLIALLEPEYNVTRGGEGMLGYVWPADARQRMSQKKMGSRGPWLGKRRPDETRQKLREVGLKNKVAWQQYAHLGPKAMARTVVCLDDGVIFESATAASRHYGVAKSALIELCLGSKGRKTVGGLRFKYVEATH